MVHTGLSVWLPHALFASLAWSSPNYWILLAAGLFIVGVLHPVPWELRTDDPSFFAHAALHVRRWTVKLLAVWLLLVPLITYVVFCLSASTPQAVASSGFLTWAADRMWDYGPGVAAACLVGFGLRYASDRYVVPRWSAYWRRHRKTQHADKPVDARDEVGSLVAKNFVPEKYYRKGHMFYGLDSQNQPIYLSLEIFITTHHALLGPTSFGKGVLTQNILQQAIRGGMTVAYIEPKDDDFIPYLMRDEAERAGRRFVYLDLNPTGPGSWHPFVGGDPRKRRSRIVSAFNLDGTGTDADVYKVRERGMLDKALERTDGSIRAMWTAVAALEKGQNGEAPELSSLRDTLAEWGKVSTFSAKGPGHSIERSLLDNAVVYVRGSLDDNVVKLATRAYLAELCGELQRLSDARPAHCVVGIAELRFMASNEVATALATIRRFRTNLLLDAQSLANLEAPDDHRVNGAALVREFEVNTRAKFVYQTGDVKTTEWAEKNSGTQFLNTIRSESVEVNKSGGEQWEARRQFSREEHPIISRNTLLNLPARVAIAFLPGRLPAPCFTSPVPVDRSVPIVPVAPAEIVAEPAPANPERSAAPPAPMAPAKSSTPATTGEAGNQPSPARAKPPARPAAASPAAQQARSTPATPKVPVATSTGDRPSPAPVANSGRTQAKATPASGPTPSTSPRPATPSSPQRPAKPAAPEKTS